MMNKSLLYSISIIFLLGCSRQTSIIESPPAKEVASRSVEEKRPENSSDKIPVDERLVSGSLPNGMQYFIQKNTKPEKNAELRLAVKAGSVLEDEDQLGVAHFVEHMAFNGTTNFKKNELIDYLESVGTRFGPDLNAYTFFDETVYMLQVKTDNRMEFFKGLLILKDWASGITFDHEEIDKERGVVVSEWRSRLSPDQRMQQVYFPVIYKGSRYAERLPIGDPEIISHGDYDIFKRFYKDWYRPELMALVIVGDIDVSEVEKQLKQIFSEIPKSSEGVRKREKFEIPSHDNTRVSIAKDKEASFTNIRIINKLPSAPTTKLTDLRESIKRSLFNGMVNARLEEIGKEPEPPFVFASTGYSPDLGNIDTYTSFAIVPEGQASNGLKRFLLENKRVLDHGFTPGELERQKTILLERAERANTEKDKTDSRQIVMRYVYHFLKGTPIPGPGQTLEIYKKFLPGITLEEINVLPKQWIGDENRVIVVTGPDKSSNPMPDEIEILAIVKEVESTETAPYEDDTLDEPLFTKVLTPVDIPIEVVHESTGIIEWVLANGVKVYLKQTQFKNDEILMSAVSQGGSSLYDDFEYFNAENAPSIISESGIGSFNSTQLEKLLAGKNVNVQPYIGTYYEGMRGNSSVKDVEDLFKLIHLYFTDIRKDENAFQSYVNKQIGIVKNLSANPNFYFSDFASKIKFRSHPRVGLPTEAKYKGLNYEKILETYKDRFADASDFAFIFVGSFDVDQMRNLAARYLGNLPSIQREETWKDLEIESFPGQIKKNTKRGQAPKSQVELYFHGPFEYSEENVYLLNSLMDYMRIKLREELREEMGGVYGVGVYGGGKKVPKEEYSITVSFNADPEKTEELIKATWDVIRNAKSYSPVDKDMVKIKETQRQSKIKNLEENRYWLNQIQNAYTLNHDFSSILLNNLEMRIEALMATDIRAAAEKYFNFMSLTQLIMHPEDSGIATQD
ncbi:MAG TPA: insulinase family protein [Saprospiraceae bacterium]|nr:insulinase family protein [Saprospiraceae bacterium]